MPSKRHLKQYRADSAYILSHEPAAGRVLFADADDFQTFVVLLRRYLSVEPLFDATGRRFKNYNGALSLMAYGLTPQRFELLVWQNETPNTISKFMHSLATAYLSYTNHKYGTSGRLFHDRFEAELIAEHDLLEASARVHSLPERLGVNGFCSLPAYMSAENDALIETHRVLGALKPAAYLRHYDELTRH